MPHVTGEITLGNIATVVTLISLAIGLGRRLGSFESTVTSHAEKITGLTTRLETLDKRLFDMVSK